MSFSHASFIYTNNKKKKNYKKKKKNSFSFLAQTSGKKHRKHLETPSVRQVSSRTDTQTCLHWDPPMNLCSLHREDECTWAHTSLADAQESARVCQARDCNCAYIRLWDGSAAWNMHARISFWSTRTKRHWKQEYLSAYAKLCLLFFKTPWLICIAVRLAPSISFSRLTRELAHQEKEFVTMNWSLPVCLKELHLTVK